MVKQKLVDAYQRLDTKRKLYKEATRRGNFLIGAGGLIFFSSIVPITPVILGELLSLLFRISLDFFLLWGGTTLFGFILMMVGTKVNRRTPTPPKLSVNEEGFLKVFEALNSLDTYFKQNIEFSRVEAAKKLSKIESDIYEPSTSYGRLWKALTKDRDEKLRLLKRNLKEKLHPAINQGEREEIKKAYSIMEKFAEYLLSPTASALEELNESTAELSTRVEKKPPLVPFFERHPKLRHAGFELVFILIGFVAYYMGARFLNIPIEHLYYLAWIIWATLTAGYMTVVMRKH